MTSNTSSQHEVITTDSSNEGEQVSENEKNWSEVPPLIIENIYSFLSRPDQTRMSLVCSRWAEEFSSPAVWKNIKFCLPQSNCSSEIYPEVKFARKYGSMFRDVEILYEIYEYNLLDEVNRQFCLFLQAMESSSQLTTIKFDNLGYFFRNADCTSNEDSFRAITRFFHSQENLESVTFRGSCFKEEQGLELLKAILHSDRNTITELSLYAFVHRIPSTEFSQQYMSNLIEVSRKFANVPTIKINYIQFFENVINCLFKELTSGEYHIDKNMLSMTSLTIYCDGTTQFLYKRISFATWKTLKNFLPNLKVKMIIRSHNSTVIENLVKEIPLQSLAVCFQELPSILNIVIQDFFRHLLICSYRDHLEYLEVHWEYLIENFASSVINFVQSCKKLQTFHFYCKYDPSEIENILQALLRSHPTSLKSITIYVLNNLHLESLADEYYHLFNSEGIECFLNRT